MPEPSPVTPRLDHLVYLEALRVGNQAGLGGYALSRMSAHQHRPVPDLDRLVVSLTTEMIGRIGLPGRYADEHRGTARVVRFATWWDHFKSVHRHRWWMSWRHWEINYHWVEETVTARLQVTLSPQVVFPQAPDVAPVLGGPAVMVQVTDRLGETVVDR